MYVQRVTNFEDLQPFRNQWDALAGDCLFRRWSWLATWWKYYGDGCTLNVLLVFDEKQVADTCGTETNCSRPKRDSTRLIGILPCYSKFCIARGRVLRLLGDGEVCTDHLDLLTRDEDVERVANAIAQHLVDSADDWDATRFTAVGTDCRGLMQLSRELTDLSCQVTQAANESRWSIELPEDWEGFLAMQSKSHRKKLRRLERSTIEKNRSHWHRVETEAEFEDAWPILIDLHQRRRISLGEPGCFASSLWAKFHRDIALQLLDEGHLRLCWLELDGAPVAVEYQFTNEHQTFAYQGGVEPERIDEQPGRLSLLCAIQTAIEAGHQTFDLLRGDEPYKAQWRATPQATVDIRAVPPRSSAVWRSRACDYMQTAARAARQFTNLLS